MRLRPLLSVLALGAAALAGDKEWAKGIPFTTDWKSAIREVRKTGKILFVYNGWERAGI